VPRLDLPRDIPLQPVPGAPPDPMEHVPGCRFHPRCGKATEICAQKIPGFAMSDGHEVACWHSGFGTPNAEDPAA